MEHLSNPTLKNWKPPGPELESLHEGICWKNITIAIELKGSPIIYTSGATAGYHSHLERLPLWTFGQNEAITTFDWKSGRTNGDQVTLSKATPGFAFPGIYTRTKFVRFPNLPAMRLPSGSTMLVDAQCASESKSVIAKVQMSTAPGGFQVETFAEVPR